MDFKELKNKELSNLYALTKQVHTYFDGSEIIFLHEETQLLLMDYIRLTIDFENDFRTSLRELGVNPGNTMDSILSEITKNLSNIIKKKISDDVKADAYKLSLNRLMGYHLANLENMKHLDMYDQEIESISTFESRLSTLKSRLLRS